MRLLAPATTLLTAAALPVVLAACSLGATTAGGAASATPSAVHTPANPDAGLLTGTQLSKLLAPASFFPSGFTLDRSGSRNTGPSYQLPSTTSVRKPKCRLLGGTGWVTITGIDGVSFAENDYINKTSPAEMAQEIDAYRGTTAQTVLRKLGRIAAVCPTYRDAQTASQAKVREQARPQLGDGGYVITVTDPSWRGGTTLVAARVGTSVVTVWSTQGASNGHASAMKLASQLVSALQAQA